MRWNSELLESTWERRTFQVAESGGVPQAITESAVTATAVRRRTLGTPDRLAGVDEHRSARYQTRLLVRREKHDRSHQILRHPDLF